MEYLTMEPLQEVPATEWSKLIALYRANFPKCVSAYAFLNMILSYPELGEQANFKVYSVNGELEHGMIATTEENNYYQVIIQPITEDLSKLEDALINTKKITWTNRLLPFTSPEVVNIFKRIEEQLGVKGNYAENVAASTLFLDRSSMKFDISCPPDTYVGPLAQEHLSLVDRPWRFYNDRSRDMFETLIKHGLFYVLYSKEHLPLSWIYIDRTGALTHLYCVEGQRTKGYAEYITKAAVNDQLEKGNDVLVYTARGAGASKTLFLKLGFKYIGDVYWVLLSNTVARL